ncbi:unnamed protein product, partial [Oppiella nova]
MYGYALKPTKRASTIAMYMSSCNSQDEHKLAETILLKIGHLFQMQDDYLDCFGNPDTIGKIGTDIQEGKCCWPIVKALEMCDQNQRQTLDTNYGINDEKCVAIVKEIYRDLNIQEVYTECEECIYNDICVMIDDLKFKSNLCPVIFYEMLDKIYKRDK